MLECVQVSVERSCPRVLCSEALLVVSTQYPSNHNNGTVLVQANVVVRQVDLVGGSDRAVSAFGKTAMGSQARRGRPP